VPKGVPLKQNETRTAFETEDHPMDYLEFEGTIPLGQYGGGTVMVWDIGTYELVEGNYWKGQITIFLAGKKLKGEWTLKRTEAEAGKTKWLLQKTDADAKPIAKRRENLSALTRRTMEDIGGKESPVRKSNRKSTQSTRQKKLHPRPAPQFVKPMKATAVTQLPEGDEWIYEVKWDGYRALALKHGDSVRLLSLKEKNLTSDFPGVAEAVRALSIDTAVIDGEIVAIDTKGCPSFQALQNRASTGRHWQILYYAFDLLNLDGEDWKNRPLHERKAKLRDLVSGSEVRYNAELPGTTDVIVHRVKETGLEGVVAKKRESLYRGGYKPDVGSFQSILVGYYDAKRLIFAGRVARGIQSTRTREVAEDDATSPNKEMSVREPAEQPKKPFRGRNHRR
jgi:bifunctional non-homologous end joining protein LigD